LHSNLVGHRLTQILFLSYANFTEIAVIVAFALFFAEFMVRYAHRSPVRRELEAPTPASDGTLDNQGFTRGKLTRNISTMLGAVSFVTLMLFIRSVLLSIWKSAQNFIDMNCQSDLPDDRAR